MQLSGCQPGGGGQEPRGETRRGVRQQQHKLLGEPPVQQCPGEGQRFRKRQQTRAGRPYGSIQVSRGGQQHPAQHDGIPNVSSPKKVRVFLGLWEKNVNVDTKSQQQA